MKYNKSLILEMLKDLAILGFHFFGWWSICDSFLIFSEAIEWYVQVSYQLIPDHKYIIPDMRHEVPKEPLFTVKDTILMNKIFISLFCLSIVLVLSSIK